MNAIHPIWLLLAAICSALAGLNSLNTAIENKGFVFATWSIVTIVTWMICVVLINELLIKVIG